MCLTWNSLSDQFSIIKFLTLKTEALVLEALEKRGRENCFLVSGPGPRFSSVITAILSRQTSFTLQNLLWPPSRHTRTYVGPTRTAGGRNRRARDTLPSGSTARTHFQSPLPVSPRPLGGLPSGCSLALACPCLHPDSQAMGRETATVKFSPELLLGPRADLAWASGPGL